MCSGEKIITAGKGLEKEGRDIDNVALCKEDQDLP